MSLHMASSIVRSCAQQPRPCHAGRGLVATTCRAGMGRHDPGSQPSKSWKTAPIALCLSLCMTSGAWARLEGVNQPNLLPQGSEITPLIDVANFLTETEETRMRDRLQHLEKDTGIKFRVLAQNYPDTPGLAIKDYWSVDDNTVVLVADPTFGNVLNFNIGINIDSFIPRNFWSKVAGRFGNKFYVEEQGRDVAIINAVAAVDHCLREPIDRTQCSEIRGELE
ncbi:CPLD31 [Auxenochlorella protothecoides x Auxenochlorella symbiontica]